MKAIMTKKEIQTFMNQFISYAQYDTNGVKYYFIFEDRKRGGQFTLMNYASGAWSIHGRGDQYCDETETELSSAEVESLIWQNRAAINAKLKEAASVRVEV